MSYPNGVKSFAVSGTLSATWAAVRGTRLYMGSPLTLVSRRVGNTKSGGAIPLVMESPILPNFVCRSLSNCCL